MMQTNSQSATLIIDVVSDVVCPWCFLGKRRLEAAIAALPDIAVAVRWRPYQLDPTVPPGGISREAYLSRRFGDRQSLEAAHDRLTEMGLREGAIYRFEKITRTPNTIDAHRLVRWAREAGREGEAVERLFRLYFSEGADVGSHDVLADVGAGLGFDRAATLQRLAGDDGRRDVEIEIAAAQEIGVTGVPTFILNGRYGVVGAQPKETLIAAIRRAAEDLRSKPETDLAHSAS